MEEVLSPKSQLSNGRYTITKAHDSSGGSIVYFAKDSGKENASCVIRAFYPCQKLSQEEQEKYDERFQSSMLILSQFDHPNIAGIYDSFIENGVYYVVMEQVDGITLQSLLSMSVKPLPEKQVIGWMLQVCQAMQYMHNRPKPFIFDALDANNIMIDQDENIKLINFGLSHFFADAKAISFSSSQALISKEIQQMGRTIAFLLTRQEVSEFGFTPGDIELSEPITKLINRLLADGNGGVNNFEKLQHELENIINPPKIKEKKSNQNKTIFKSINYGKIIDGIIEKFMGQPVWLIGGEFLVLIAVSVAVYLFFNPPIHERTQAAVYVACGNELHIFDAVSKEHLGRVRTKYNFNTLLPSRDGIKIYCSLNKSSHVAIFNSKTNQLIDSFPVGKNPGKMIMDPSESWLYVLHSNEGLITAVQTSPEPLPDLPKINFAKEKAISMYSVGSDARGLAIYTTTDLKIKKDKDSQNQDIILCTSNAGNTIDAFTNPPMQSQASQYCKSAGPIAVTKDGSVLIVGQAATSVLEFYQASGLKNLGEVTQTGGNNLRQIIISPSSLDAWCIYGSGTVGLVDIESKQLTNTIKLNGTPVSAVWNPLGDKQELWVASASPNSVAIIDTAAKTVSKTIKIGGTPSDICLIKAPPAAK